MSPASTLLCTVGTSILSNLRNVKPETNAALASAYAEERWKDVALELANLSSDHRICGAEINSIASMIEMGYVQPNCRLVFFHSATEEGRLISQVLRDYFNVRSKHPNVRSKHPVELVEVPDLQDKDTKRFRTHGLRNLARLLCKSVRDYTAPACAINATGGYKAQIAIGVLLGQAIGIPVYYKHEQFPEIIAFPPLPVALDFEVWMQCSGMLFDLAKSKEVMRFAEYQENWDERYESLIERVEIDGADYIEMSATGQIFHDTFRERFRSQRDQVLPPAAVAGCKQRPIIRSNEAKLLRHESDIRPFMQRVTDEVPQVVLCMSSYFNPDLSTRTGFHLRAGEIEGVLSMHGWTVKFRVETTAETEGQRRAVVAALNEWLDQSY